VELDLWVRGVDRLDSIGGDSVTGYATLDARIAWKPIYNLELSLVGQNLLQNQHEEFRPELLFDFPSEVKRSVYGKITWRF
jgi:iron complex outermembrane receptor protein